MRAWIPAVLALAVGCTEAAEPVVPDGGTVDKDVGATFVPIQISSLDPPPNFFGIWGTGPNDIYVVGERGLIVHYDGASWATETTSITEDLRSVSGFATGQSYDVYAVGGAGRVLHLHLDPTLETPQERRWAAESSGTRADLTSVAAGRNRVVAVGVGGVVVEREEPAGWTVARSDTTERLNGVWVDDSGDTAVAVGNLGVIVRRENNAWARQRVAGLVTQLNQVWGTSTDQLLIVGLDGTLLRSSGTDWTPIEGAPQVNLRDVHGLSVGSAFIVGMSGTLVGLEGDQIVPVQDASSYRLEAVWGTRFYFDAGVDGGPTEKPLYYVVGVSGVALQGP